MLTQFTWKKKNKMQSSLSFTFSNINAFHWVWKMLIFPIFSLILQTFLMFLSLFLRFYLNFSKCEIFIWHFLICVHYNTYFFWPLLNLLQNTPQSQTNCLWCRNGHFLKSLKFTLCFRWACEGDGHFQVLLCFFVLFNCCIF